MAWTDKELDPKGVIRESYRIEGISAPECRSIFFDWAMSVPDGADPRPRIEALIARYGEAEPKHPMTGVLRAGLAEPPRARRRGGRTGRTASGP
ncbi:MAG: hypothetical protein AAFY77_02980 [Pseudomonadota bacterium]